MTQINIEIPEGHEIDLKRSDLTKGVVAFKKIAIQLPRSWKELNEIKGFFVNIKCDIVDAGETETDDCYKDVFATEAQAQASLALAQLSQLREVYRQGWTPDWTDNQNKYCVVTIDIRFVIERWVSTHHFLSFQTKEIAEEFRNKFCDLIEQANPLMS
jgi:hypothetical protein